MTMTGMKIRRRSEQKAMICLHFCQGVTMRWSTYFKMENEEQVRFYTNAVAVALLYP